MLLKHGVGGSRVGPAQRVHEQELHSYLCLAHSGSRQLCHGKGWRGKKAGLVVGSLVFWTHSCCPKAKHLCQGNVLVCFRAKTKSPLQARSKLNWDCTFEGCAHPAKPLKNAQRRQVDMPMHPTSSQPLEEAWPSSVFPPESFCSLHISCPPPPSHARRALPSLLLYYPHRLLCTNSAAITDGGTN